MTSNDRDLNDLKRAMDAATPAPNAARKADILARANATFDAALGSRNGPGKPSALSQKRGILAAVIDGIFTKTAGALTATTALVAGGFLLFSPEGGDLLRNLQATETLAAHPDSASAFSDAEIAAIIIDAAPETDPATPMVEMDATIAPLALGSDAEAVGDRQLGSAGARSGTDASGSLFPSGSVPRPAEPSDLTFGDAPPVAAPAIVETATARAELRGDSGARPASDGAALDTDELATTDETPLRITADDPASTFSVEVGIASYAVLRASLNRGQLPARDAVRVEDMVNYFPYNYRAPTADDAVPVLPTVSVFPTPWNADTLLVGIAFQGELAVIDDRRIQVAFDPNVIAAYRLIGNEPRARAGVDPADDAVDAAEVAVGRSVTAIFEVTPVGSPASTLAPLHDGATDTDTTTVRGELGVISMRWRAPGADGSTLVDFPIAVSENDPGTDAQFAAAIAGFGQLLRGSEFLGDWGYADVIALASANLGADQFGYRAEAVQLMRIAQSLSGG